MSKGLEALKIIKNVEVEIGNDLNTVTKVFEIEHQYDKAFDIVEKELKAFEIISKCFNMWVEVIKDYKGNPIYRLVLCYNLSDRFYLNITKEQFDLLKEVLKNE